MLFYQKKTPSKNLPPYETPPPHIPFPGGGPGGPSPPAGARGALANLPVPRLLVCNSSAGVQGDAVPLPEREVPSLPSLFPRLPPQAAQARYLNSYLAASRLDQIMRSELRGDVIIF